MEKLRQWIDWAEAHPKVWLDCVRIYLGLGLFIRGVFIISNTRAEFVQVLLERMHYPWIVTVVLLHYIALAHLIGGMPGVLVVFAILCALAVFMWLRSRRQPVDASNVTADWDDKLAPAPGASETVTGEGRS